MGTRRGPLAVLAALALAAGGCGDGGGEPGAGEGEVGTTLPPRTTPRATTTEPAAATQTCTNDEAGYRVSYPAEWHTNPGDVVPACSFFDSEPVEVPEAQEVFDLAVSIKREPVRFERVTAGDPGTRILSSEETTVAGRPAVRRETEATGAALLPEGIHATQYLVDLDGETLFASTYDVEGVPYEEAQIVLDRMMGRLELTGS